MELVSIIVPIYGVEKYLRKCVESICNQTYRNIEIILVNDGSKDSCPAICDEYANIDERIIVIHKENGGLVSARKAGVERALGKYVQFVDGDDWIDENLVESMVNIVDKYQVDCVKSTYFRVGNIIQKSNFLLKPGYYNYNEIETELYGRMLFSGRYFSFGIEPNVWSAFFRKDLLVDIIKQEPEDITLGEDAAVMYLYLLKCYSIYLLDEPHYYYRLNINSMCQSYNNKQTMTTISLINYMNNTLAEFKKYNLDEQVNYYHLAIATSNFYNESKAGLGNGFFKRVNNLKAFVEETYMKDVYRNIDKTLIKRMGKKMLLWSYVHGLIVPCLILFSVVNMRRTNKKRK